MEKSGNDLFPQRLILSIDDALIFLHRLISRLSSSFLSRSDKSLGSLPSVRFDEIANRRIIKLVNR